MMEALQLMVVLLCMVGHGFFAGMETGVISIHRMRLRHFVRKGSYSAKILQEFLENSDRLLGTTLVGTNVLVVINSVVAASIAVRLVGRWGEALSTVLVSILVLVFCEFLPKAWFRSRPLVRTMRYVTLLRFWEWVLLPVSAPIIWFTKWIVPGSSRSFTKPIPFVTREDLKILAKEGEKDGVLSEEERVMIHRVMELSGKKACEIMVPRSKMTTVRSDMPVSEFFEIARKTNFTRMPVLAGDKGRFVGVINVFHVLSQRGNNGDKTVADFMRPPLFVPGAMPVDDIFPLLRRSMQPMCFITNETSDVTGLVTTEDILEEIVGEMVTR